MSGGYCPYSYYMQLDATYSNWSKCMRYSNGKSSNQWINHSNCQAIISIRHLHTSKQWIYNMPNKHMNTYEFSNIDEASWHIHNYNYEWEHANHMWNLNHMHTSVIFIYSWVLPQNLKTTVIRKLTTAIYGVHKIGSLIYGRALRHVPCTRHCNSVFLHSSTAREIILVADTPYIHVYTRCWGTTGVRTSSPSVGHVCTTHGRV